MRQLAFKFVRQLEHVMRFPPEVERELLRQMAKAILRVSQTEGGSINERLQTAKRQDHRKPSQP